MDIKDILKLDQEQKIVAHYTRRETAVNYILKDKSIRFNPIIYSNDPFEYKGKINGISAQNLTEEVLQKLRKEINNETDLTTVKAKSFCCSISNHKDDFKVKTSSFGNMMMWDRYGENHQGICLIFSKEELDTIFYRKVSDYEIIRSKALTYEDIKNPFVDLKTVRINENKSGKELVFDHYEKYMDDLFFYKDSSWSNENEYRYLIIDQKESDIKINFKDALIGIVVGERFDDLLLPQLYQFGLPVYQCCVTSRADEIDWVLLPLYPNNPQNQPHSCSIY